MPTDSKKSRLKLINTPDIPEIIGTDQYSMLLVWMDEIGYIRSGFNGAEALTYTEIASWQSLTQTTLSQQDANLMRQLSEHYADQHTLSKDKNCPAPYRPELLTVDDEQANADKVVDFFLRIPAVKR